MQSFYPPHPGECSASNGVLPSAMAILYQCALLALLLLGGTSAECLLTPTANAVSTCSVGTHEDGSTCAITCNQNFALQGKLGARTVTIGCFSSSWDKDLAALSCDRKWQE